MKDDKRRRLERAGWKVGDTQSFLDLSDEEVAYLEFKQALGAKLRMFREQRVMTQTGLAELIGSSQSRVAKMEGGDPSVSLDLLIKALFNIGATPAQIGRAMAASGGSQRNPDKSRVARARGQALARMGGTEPDLAPVPRRR